MRIEKVCLIPISFGIVPNLYTTLNKYFFLLFPQFYVMIYFIEQIFALFIVCCSSKESSVISFNDFSPIPNTIHMEYQ